MKQMINIYNDTRMTKTERKAARSESHLERLMEIGSRYMANFAVVRGNMPSFSSSFFLQ